MLKSVGFRKTSVAFGVGKNFWFFSVHEITQALGPDRCVALPMFHAVTECDIGGLDTGGGSFGGSSPLNYNDIHSMNT